MKTANRSCKILCILMALIICVLTLSSCKSAKLTPSKLALTEVGKVGDQTVYYEELYYLASAYKSAGMTAEQLWKVIDSNIITNHAINILCSDLGVSYDEKQLDDDVQAYVDNVVNTDCGSVSAYRDALKENNMTDHYMRFIAKTDLLYEKIPETLALNGELISDKDEFISYVKKNFIRTWHFMIADNKGDDNSKNGQDIHAAHAALVSGTTNIYKLTSGKYDLPNGSQNEDVMMPADGYAFTRGNMEKAYEDAAFALEVDEYSNVVISKGELANGEYVDCYYVIQRLELGDDYINANYNDLYDSYVSAIAAQKLDEIKSNVTFEANDYARSLDILNLKPVGIGTDVRAIIIICVCVIAVAGITVATVMIVLHVRKNRRSRNGSARLNAGKRNRR